MMTHNSTNPDSTDTRDSANDGRSDAAGRLALAVGRINRRMITGGTGLSHGALSALSSLVKLGPLRIGDLAAQEHVAAATVTRIVAGLEAKNLAAREVDPADRRSAVIEATREGMELVLRARSVRAELIGKLLDTLSDQELRAVTEALPALESLVTADIADAADIADMADAADAQLPHEREDAP